MGLRMEYPNVEHSSIAYESGNHKNPSHEINKRGSSECKQLTGQLTSAPKPSNESDLLTATNNSLLYSPRNNSAEIKQLLENLKAFLCIIFTVFDRLETFANYSEKSEISTAEAAYAGFVALNYWRDIVNIPLADDTLLCPKCYFLVSNIQPNTNLLRLHTAESPECELALELNEELQIIDQGSLLHTTNTSSSGISDQIVVAHSDWTTPSSIPQEDQSAVEGMLAALGMTQKDEGNLGIARHDPKYPTMASEDQRKDSFMFYDNPSAIDVKLWSAAGFFWEGYQHFFTCYACGLKLEEPHLYGDPFAIHVAKNTECPFVSTYSDTDRNNTIDANQTDAQQPSSKSPEISDQEARRHVKAHFDRPVVQNLMSSPDMFEGIGGAPTSKEMKLLLITRLKAGKPDYTRESEIMEDILEQRADSRHAERKSTIRDARPAMKAIRQQTPVNPKSRRGNQHQDNEELPVNTKEWTKNTRDLTNSITCPICYAELATKLLLPCTHLGGCGRCVLSLNNCPLCRQRVSGTVNVAF